jgi:hypothetical protein
MTFVFLASQQTTNRTGVQAKTKHRVAVSDNPVRAVVEDDEDPATVVVSPSAGGRPASTATGQAANLPWVRATFSSSTFSRALGD